MRKRINGRMNRLFRYILKLSPIWILWGFFPLNQGILRIHNPLSLLLLQFVLSWSPFWLKMTGLQWAKEFIISVPTISLWVQRMRKMPSLPSTPCIQTGVVWQCMRKLISLTSTRCRPIQTCVVWCVVSLWVQRMRKLPSLTSTPCIQTGVVRQRVTRRFCSSVPSL